MTIKSIDPTTGKVIDTHASTTPVEARAAVWRAGDAQKLWRTTTFAKRSAIMLAAAALLRDRADTYARLMAREMGKVVAEGRAEIDKCAWLCEYYAAEGEAFLAPEHVDTGAHSSFVAYRPLGVVLAIMPWNFPFWQVFRAAVPAILAGNAVVLKHASNVPGCALAIHKLFASAGLPAGLFQSVLVPSTEVESLIAEPSVAAVTLTGSTVAGRAVAAAAGEHLKPAVLELGGSDAYVILDDAELPAAVECCVESRLINAGQSCIAAKRFIVVNSVREEFERRMVERMESVRMGSPLDDATDMGPLARADLRDTLHDQVTRTIAKGARRLLGGEVPAGEGSFYPPTILSDVGIDCPAYREELFGPVATIIPATHEIEAIKIANDTNFGLGAAVFTRNLARGTAIARDQLEAGVCFVNDYVRSDPRMPFGGIKDSGYGRELARPGIRAFVNVKTVSVR